MNQVVIYHDDSGKMNIMIPANNVYVPNIDGTPARYEFTTFMGDDILGVTIDNGEEKATHRKATIEEIAARDVPDGMEWHIVDRESLPQDRYFRSAWQHENGQPFIDMDKARDIQKDKLRLMRADNFSALDVQQKRALVSGDTAKVQEIEIKLQALRDVTKDPALEAATTPDELKIAGINIIKGI